MHLGFRQLENSEDTKKRKVMVTPGRINCWLAYLASSCFWHGWFDSSQIWPMFWKRWIPLLMSRYYTKYEMSKTKQWNIDQTGKRWLWFYLAGSWNLCNSAFLLTSAVCTKLIFFIFFQNFKQFFFLILYFADFSLTVGSCIWLALVLAKPWRPTSAPFPHMLPTMSR